MKFIKNGIIYTTNNEFVISQMKKNGGFVIYEEVAKEEKVDVPKETKEEVKEVKKSKKK